MKKVLLALVAVLFIVTSTFAQQTTSTKPTKTKTHQTHKKHKKQKKQPTAKNTAASNPSMNTTMNPTSGSKSNGAGKSAKVQTTTKEKADNLNEMDASRN